MAKAKSSQQEDLTASRTGIDMTFGLGFGPKRETAAAKTPLQTDITPPENVDKLVEPQPTSDTTTKKSTVDERQTIEAKPEPAESVSGKTSKARTASKKTKEPSSKLQKPANPDKDTTVFKISALISARAKENLDKYAGLYGYKKLSPFINDLLEHLDAYMDED